MWTSCLVLDDETCSHRPVLRRNLELILFGGQTQCVVVDLGDEMPSPADVQLAHTRLRTLCLGGEEFTALD